MKPRGMRQEKKKDENPQIRFFCIVGVCVFQKELKMFFWSFFAQAENKKKQLVDQAVMCLSVAPVSLKIQIQGLQHIYVLHMQVGVWVRACVRVSVRAYVWTCVSASVCELYSAGGKNRKLQ